MELNRLTAANVQSGALPDWQPDIDRLKSQARRAEALGRSDPWTLAEAECWLDLIDAEISAQTHVANEGALRLLRIWKAELGGLVRAAQRNSQPAFPYKTDQARAA